MNRDDLADLEGEAAARFALHGLDDYEPPHMVQVCLAITGKPPARGDIEPEAKLEEDQVIIRRDVPPRRARFLAAHECAEKIHLDAGYTGEDIEARCDALGAMLTAPRRGYLRAVRELGHSVYKLADRFAVTQSLSLLRLGETTGRPVMLLRPAGQLARGLPFAWPSTSTMVRALNEGREAVHPMRIRDEPDRWGLLARR